MPKNEPPKQANFYTINLKAGKFDIILMGVSAGLKKIQLLAQENFVSMTSYPGSTVLKKNNCSILKLFKNSITTLLLKHQSLFSSR
jgi:hypothetical protein